MRFKIISAANGALETLRRVRTGVVHSVFDRTFNLLVSGKLVGVLSEDMPLNPIGLRSDIPGKRKMGDFGLRKRLPVLVEETRITIGGLLELDLRGVKVWKPRTKVFAPSTLREVRENLELVKKEVTTVEGRAGFIPLLRRVEEPLLGVLTDAGGLSNLCRKALTHILKLVSCIEKLDERGLDKSVKNLVGLGPGLTPSGDDFLCGFLASLNWVLRSYGVERRLETVEGSVLEHAGRTNLLSRQLLEHAVRGEVGERAENFLSALLGDEGGDLKDLTFRVSETGETSGADMLLGLILGAEVGVNLISPMHGVKQIQK
jgi:hypothetical protein